MRTPKLLRFFLLVLLLILLAFPARVQEADAPLLAFLNSSGQLIVASADGITRWIVSNPGETIDPELGFSWSPDGEQLFYAVQQGDRLSLRIGDAGEQAVAEVGTVGTPASGGEWVGDGVRVVDPATDALYSLDGVAQRREAVADLLSPFWVGEPHLPPVSSFSAETQVVFAQQSSGYGLLTPDGSFRGLGIGNNRRAPRSGLWSDVAPLVAYWGDLAETGDPALAVTHAETGAQVTLSGSAGTPMQPILWLEGSTVLVYRDASSQLRAADLACLLSSCALNPLETGVAFLPPSANDVQQVADGRVVFRESETLRAVDPACLPDDTCLEEAVTLQGQVAPRTFFDAVESSIAVTTYDESATDPADRRVLVLDAACPPDAECAPFSLPNAVSGLLSPDARHLVAEVLDDGLTIVSLDDGSRVFLTGGGSYSDLLRAIRWNG